MTKYAMKAKILLFSFFFFCSPLSAADYYWMDGDRRFSLTQVPGIAADFIYDDFELRARAGLGDVREEYPTLYIYELEGSSLAETEDFFINADPALSPVFYERGGGLKSLPGGVILIFKQGVEKKEIDDFFGKEKVKATQLSWHPRGYFAETSPGLESLHLANRLSSIMDMIEVSSPNWWSNAYGHR